jgi:hypothetical protein
MLDRALITAASQVLQTNWQVELGGLSPFDVNRQILLEALSERILALLRHRPEKLLSALYILDIGEVTYQQAMEQDSMQDRAWALAIAVYDRETEKIRLREKYSGEYRKEIDS